MQACPPRPELPRRAARLAEREPALRRGPLALKDLHPTLSAAERRRLFHEGIELFNRGDFFASHESWEEIWRSTEPEPKDLFQGLIQVAAALHLFLTLGRPEAARRTLAKARRRLKPFPSVAHGLDVGTLIEQARAWEDWLADRQGEAPSPPSIRILEPADVR